MTEKSLLKPFEPMLASPRGKLAFPCMIQPKYDGIRCVVRGGVAYSRNLEPIRNQLIRDTLSNAMFNGFDGELILGDPTHKDVYNNTQDVVMDTNADPTGICYYVFDDFSDPRKQYQFRFLLASGRVRHLHEQGHYIGMIEAVPAMIADTEDELMALADPLFDMGYEGAMVRKLDAIYKHGRATESEGSLWKIKRMQDDEMFVTSVEEGTTNTNEATTDARGKTKRSKAKAGMVPNGKLGCLVGSSPKWPGEEIRVGSSNLPDMTLEEAAEHFVGQLVVFKHQPAGAKDAPRFPIYKGIRDPADLS